MKRLTEVMFLVGCGKNIHVQIKILVKDRLLWVNLFAILV